MTRLKQLLGQLPPLQTELTQPLKAFTLFPKLPPEVRIMIWEYAAMVPRDIKLFVLEADRRSSRIEGQSIAPAIMHTSREARQEGKRYYTLWREKCPQEGKNIFRDWRNLRDVEIQPSEYVRNARPNINNKVWVNVVTDRFVFHDMKGHADRLQMSISLEDYNFCLNDILRIRHGGSEVDAKLSVASRTGATRPLFKTHNLESAVVFIANWKYLAAAGIQGVRDQSEETLATHLAFRAFMDAVSRAWEIEKRRGIRNFVPTVKFRLDEEIDLPPCRALLL